MFSLRSTLATRHLPPGYNISKGIGTLCGPRPISITNLQNLPPESITFNIPEIIGELLLGDIYGQGTLTLQSNGMWSLKGHIHNGNWIGQSYRFGALLDFIDPTGVAYYFYHDGNVAAHDDNDYLTVGYKKEIADYWEQIKKSKIYPKLHSSTESLDAFLKTLSVLVPLGVLILALTSGARTENDPRHKCVKISTGPPYEEDPYCYWTD
ncbi:hypothetical protein DN407_29335 (plasmid) [Bacillus sp. JAS24-2]|uniref:hypothetical protein n=1 Tax=Bacillus sp. JAS24-2 TaxID=2217832 RepID=UPI0011EBB771|nr:hypothetical protein [Bacillus sp. JAS24-2]QEL82603.1 hypothetical protein DN407_29335 [Bacillus sp. JAS24-2]